MRNTTATTARPTRQAASLGALCLEGQRLLARMDAHAASDAFGRFVGEAIEAGSGWAEDPALHEAMHRAVAGLADCLPLMQDMPARQRAFQSLFQAYQADARSQCNGLTREIPFLLLQRALPRERHMLSGWVRSALAMGEGPAAAEANWRLLLDLADAGSGPLQALLDECRAAGHANVVAEKLLDMDRVGEALITARRELKTTDALLRFANSPAAHGQARAVMALVAERLDGAFDARLADWLAERHAERGDLPQALELRLRLLHAAPGRGDYEKAEALARRLGTWDRLQPELVGMLQRSGRAEALAELALAEGDLARALAYVAKAPERYGAVIVARLAEYAAGANFEAAVALYRHLLERALAGQPAAGSVEDHLKHLRDVFDAAGALDEWEAYLEDLKERFGLKIWG